MHPTADLRRVFVAVALQAKSVGRRGNQFYPGDVFICSYFVAAGATHRDRRMNRFPFCLVLVALQTGGRVGFGIKRNRMLDRESAAGSQQQNQPHQDRLDHLPVRTLPGSQASLHHGLMHETGLIKRAAGFFDGARKLFDSQLLQRCTAGDVFFNSRCRRPRWANSHSGLGEMTQVIWGENPLPCTRPKSEIEARNAILDIRHHGFAPAIGPSSRPPVISNGAGASKRGLGLLLLCDMAQTGWQRAPPATGNLLQINDFTVSSGLARNVHFSHSGRRDMATTLRSAGRKLWQTMSSIKTGVILLIVVVIFSAAGTVILQRPTTDAEDIQRAYSPQMLRILDFIGLTDVFHSWWFVLLLLLVSLSIIAASIQRFPNSWRYFSRPYKVPDESFRKALPNQAQIVIEDEAAGLAAAESAWRKMGFRPQRVLRNRQESVFGERSRLSEMAVYIVHASLLLIFVGGIVDALYGWRGFVALTRGQQSNIVELRDKTGHVLPFAVRCDAAGQENYQDGTPKKWWSKLAVVENGQEVMRKEIVVNDPLVYRGVRFYQASYGSTGKVDKLLLTASPATASGGSRDIALGMTETIALDPDTSVRIAEFIPDYVVRDGQVYTRSAQVENPAVHLVVESKGKSVNVWMPPIPGFAENEKSPYKFEAKDLQMSYFTGLEVSHEPGQWAVWAGVLLMALGLAAVFYMVHVRLWAVPVRDARGRLTLWVGGTANKNKDVFEQRFQELVEKIRLELKAQPKPCPREQVASLAGD